MSIGYISGRDIYTALSTDDISGLEVYNGTKMFITDEGKCYIYNLSIREWEIDRTFHTGYMTKTNGNLYNMADAIDSVVSNKQVITGDIFSRYFDVGNKFGAGYRWEDVPNNYYAIFNIFTINAVQISYKVSGTGLTDYGVYVNATLTDNGTPISIISRNATVPFTPNLTVYVNPTYSDLGHNPLPRFLGSNTTPSNRINDEKNEQGFVMRPNSNYLIVAKNVSGSTQPRMGMTIDWNEIIE